jgi:hypothetical protein
VSPATRGDVPIDAASIAAAALARRLTWLMLVRTLVISAVLGLSLWLGSGRARRWRPAERFLLGVVWWRPTRRRSRSRCCCGATRRPGWWPQLAGDLASPRR